MMMYDGALSDRVVADLSSALIPKGRPRGGAWSELRSPLKGRGLPCSVIRSLPGTDRRAIISSLSPSSPRRGGGPAPFIRGYPHRVDDPALTPRRREEDDTVRYRQPRVKNAAGSEVRTGGRKGSQLSAMDDITSPGRPVSCAMARAKAAARVQRTLAMKRSKTPPAFPPNNFRYTSPSPITPTVRKVTGSSRTTTPITTPRPGRSVTPSTPWRQDLSSNSYSTLNRAETPTTIPRANTARCQSPPSPARKRSYTPDAYFARTPRGSSDSPSATPRKPAFPVGSAVEVVAAPSTPHEFVGLRGTVAPTSEAHRAGQVAVSFPLPLGTVCMPKASLILVQPAETGGAQAPLEGPLLSDDFRWIPLPLPPLDLPETAPLSSPREEKGEEKEKTVPYHGVWVPARKQYYYRPAAPEGYAPASWTLPANAYVERFVGGPCQHQQQFPGPELNANLTLLPRPLRRNGPSSPHRKPPQPAPASEALPPEVARALEHLAMCEADGGSFSMFAAVASWNLAVVLCRHGDPQVAALHATRAMRVFEELGEMHHAVGARGTLCNALCLCGRGFEAVKMLREHVDPYIFQNEKSNSELVWIEANNLAVLIQASDSFFHAEPYARAAVAEFARLSGPNDTKTTAALCNLTMILSVCRGDDEAALLASRAKRGILLNPEISSRATAVLRHLSDIEVTRTTNPMQSTVLLEKEASERTGATWTNTVLASVAPGSPADRCGLGLFKGHTLLDINGRTVSRNSEVRAACEGAVFLVMSFGEKVPGRHLGVKPVPLGTRTHTFGFSSHASPVASPIASPAASPVANAAASPLASPAGLPAPSPTASPTASPQNTPIEDALDDVVSTGSPPEPRSPSACPAPDVPPATHSSTSAAGTTPEGPPMSPASPTSFNAATLPAAPPIRKSDPLAPDDRDSASSASSSSSVSFTSQSPRFIPASPSQVSPSQASPLSPPCAASSHDPFLEMRESHDPFEARDPNDPFSGTRTTEATSSLQIQTAAEDVASEPGVVSEPGVLHLSTSTDLSPYPSPKQLVKKNPSNLSVVRFVDKYINEFQLHEATAGSDDERTTSSSSISWGSRPVTEGHEATTR